MANRQAVVQEMIRRGYNGPEVQPGYQPQKAVAPAAPAQQPQQPSQGIILDLVNKLDKSGTIAATLGRASSGFAAGAGINLPTQKDNLDAQYKQEQIKALQNKRDIPGYIAVPDGNGGFSYVPTPQGAKTQIAPGAVTEAGQRKTEAQADLSTAQAGAANTGNQIMKNATSGQNGDITPGTTFTGGGVTVPLNPVLNDTQVASISGVQSLDPIIKRIEDQINGGIFNSDFGNIGRTARQAASGSQIPMLTSYDSKLQSLQSDLNTLKKTIPFTEGGKQLTPFEAKQVFALLETTGKNDSQIINDINQAMTILRSKSKIAIGGRNAAIGQPDQQNPNDFSNLSDEELQKIVSGQ